MAGGPVSSVELDAALLISSPVEVPAALPLGRLGVVSGAAEGWLLETLGAASEACSEVEVLELVVEAELTACGSTRADVVGTTVGSSSSTVRSTTSAAFCRRGWMTVETLLRERCSGGRAACELEPAAQCERAWPSAERDL